VEVMAEAREITAESERVGAVEVDFYKSVEEYEKLLIRRALLQARGNQAQAARMLRLNPTTLNHKIKTYRINSYGRANASGGDAVAAERSESAARRQAAP
jgi:DNA-binding NtrC family response regulator